MSYTSSTEKPDALFHPDTVVVNESEAPVMYQTDEDFAQHMQTDVVQRGASQGTQMLELRSMSPETERFALKTEVDTDTAVADNVNQSVAYICADFNPFNTEEMEATGDESTHMETNGDTTAEATTVDFDEIEPYSSATADNPDDSELPTIDFQLSPADSESSIIRLNAGVSPTGDGQPARSEFVCTDYQVPVKEEEVANEDLSRYRAETFAALKAIKQARRDLESEVRLREEKIKTQQAELCRLSRELKEIKQLERAEMKKLNLIDAKTTEGKKFVSRPVNYTLSRGSRYNSLIYEAASGHMYISKGSIYLKCILVTRRANSCPGLAKLATDGLLMEGRDHNHAPDDPDLLRRRLINKVRNAVRDDRNDRIARDIFDEIVGASPYRHLLEFRSIATTLRKDKRRKDEGRLMETIFKSSAVSKHLARATKRPVVPHRRKRQRVSDPASDDSEGGADCSSDQESSNQEGADSDQEGLASDQEGLASDQEGSGGADPDPGSPAGSAGEADAPSTPGEALSQLCQTVVGDPEPSDQPQSTEARPTGQSSPLQPAGQEPEAQQPAGQEPEAQQPAGQEPEAQQPAGQEPEAQQPARQEPEARQPAGQELPGQEDGVCETPAGTATVVPGGGSSPTAAQPVQTSVREQWPGIKPSPLPPEQPTPRTPHRGEKARQFEPRTPRPGPKSRQSGPRTPQSGPRTPRPSAGPRRPSQARHSSEARPAAPPRPSGPAQSYTEVLKTAPPELQRNLAFMLKDNAGRETGFAFMAPVVAKTVRNSGSYRMQLDASPKLSPPVGGVFPRLLLVSLSVERQLRPGYLLLLREVSRPVLAEVFSALKRRLGAAPPEHVVCAPDPVLLAATADSWPQAGISCAVSQYCRLLLAKVVQGDLSAQFSGWEPVREWLTMLLAVPFLPPQKMADALENLNHVIPKQLDGHTRQGLRQLGVYVTEQWLWKLGAAKFSVHHRPRVDELDTAQFMREFQIRYGDHRQAGGGPDADFWPFVRAVSEVLQAADRALERGRTGELCWPRARLLEPLLGRPAGQPAEAAAFLRAAGRLLLAEGLPPGCGVSSPGDAAAADPATSGGGDSPPSAAEAGSRGRPGRAGTSGRAPADRSGDRSVLREVQVKLSKIRKEHATPPRRSSRRH